VQFEIRLHAIHDLRAVIGERTREFGNHADLHRRLLRLRDRGTRDESRTG